MSSKDVKPKHRIGETESSPWQKAAGWVIFLALAGGGAYAAYRYVGTTVVEVPVIAARTGEFAIGVKTRGELAAVRSMILRAPQVPNLKIVQLVKSGTRVKAGEVIVQFDTAQIEQAFLDRSSNVRTIDSEIVQMQANQKIADEQDAVSRTTANYTVQRTELDASKAEVVSKVEGEKTRVDVTVAKGELGQVDAAIRAHDVAQNAEAKRQASRKDKAQRDLEQVRGYLQRMAIRAPIDGVVTVLPNLRAQGSSGNFGSTPPAFQEGDTVWFGAPIIEIPDPTSMRIEIRLDEVDRGKIKLGQPVKVRVDALPNSEADAMLDWISPIAQVEIKGNMTEKSFPVRATLASVDPRIRPGMSASADIITSSSPGALMIPLRASFTRNGKPAVFVQNAKGFEQRPIEVGARNETDIVVLSGLKAGERVALEDPQEALKRAKKL
jgi:multidrug efflux pump subunit AcrA (membrane-fusion protein)